MEKEISKYIDKLINDYLKSLFGNLVDFVKTYARAETEAAMVNMGEEFKNILEQDKKSG
jgi:hypothetical protein